MFCNGGNNKGTRARNDDNNKINVIVSTSIYLFKKKLCYIYKDLSFVTSYPQVRKTGGVSSVQGLGTPE